MDSFDKFSIYFTYLRKTYRIFDLSIIDYLGSYLVIFLLLQITKTPFNPKYYTAMLPLAVIAHIATGQKTTFTKRITSSDINISKIWLANVIFMTVYYHLYYTPTL